LNIFKLFCEKVLFIFVMQMKFYEKYPQLKEKEFLAELLSKSVFATMALENQQVPMKKIQEIVKSLLNEKESKGGQFFSDQIQ